MSLKTKILLGGIMLCTIWCMPIYAQQAGDAKDQSSSITAWDLYSDKQFDQAIELFKQDANNHPDWCDPYDGLGWSYLQKGDFLTAEANFKKCLSFSPYYVNSLNGIAEVNAWRYRRFNRAWGYYYAAQYTKAAEIFSEILQDKTGRLPETEMWRVHTGLAWSLYNLNHNDEAINQFNLTLSLQKNNTDAINGIGLSYFQKGNLDQALTFFNQSLALNSLQADIQSKVGWVYERKGDLNRALAEFQKAQQINPYLADAYKGLAWTEFDLKDYAKAKQNFITAINIDPSIADQQFKEALKVREDWHDLYNVLGWSYYIKGQNQLGEQTFKEGLGLLRDDAELLRGLGYVQYKLGNFDQAIRSLKQSLRQNANLAPVAEYVTVPGTITTYYIQSDALSTLAWCYFKKKDYNAAIDRFNEAADKNPKWIDIQDGLGWSYFMKKDYARAEAAFKKALAIDPSYGDALNGITALQQTKYGKTEVGWSYYYQGSYLWALQQFQYDLAQNQNLPPDKQLSLQSGIAWSQLMLGQTNQAEGNFHAILEKDRENSDALWGLGTITYQKQNYDSAVQALSQAVSKQPDNYGALTTLAWSYYKLKDYSHAVEAFQKAIKVNPYFVEPHYGLGLSQFYANDLKSAKSSFESAIDIYPGYVLTDEFKGILQNQQGWEDLYTRLGWSFYYKSDYNDALAMFKKVSEKDTSSQDASLGLGSIYFQQGDYKGAIDRLESLLSAKPQAEKGWLKWSVVLSNLAWSYFYTGKFDKALAYFKQLVDLHKGDEVYADPYTGMGWASLRQGNKQDARQDFQKAITLVPGYVGALNGLAELDKRGGM